MLDWLLCQICYPLAIKLLLLLLFLLLLSLLLLLLLLLLLEFLRESTMKEFYL